ncbi:MAG: Ig-like domain-containing protein, partial [Acidobacteriota bacterium]|nr:Ig-like domain-containing protein [Acidobacteriota bacterium]
MKLFLTIAAALVPAFLAVGLASGQQQDDLKAVYNLSGVLQDLGNKELVVTFSDDMLPLGGKRDGAAILKINPAIKGEFFWRGNRTLAFKPSDRFRYSTTYSAVIPAGTKSLAGKTFPRELRWQWSTPQAYPVEVTHGNRDYFSRLTPGEKLDGEIWVKDSVTLRFDQPVAAAEARSFFMLKEAKSGEPAAILISQKTSEELEVRFAKILKRGMLYQFIVKKGFRGSEGDTGTARDFTFTFDTVPSFHYAGQRPLVLFPDSPHVWLPFSNALGEFNDRLIQVHKISGTERSPLKFHLESRYYENQTLFISVDDELASGDRLSISVDRDLANTYKERLPDNLELEAQVCSSRSPRLDFSLREGKIALNARSMKRADVRLMKLKPGFYSQLHKRDFAIMKQGDFRAEFIEKEILQSLADLPEKTNSPHLHDDELGSPLGFFGVLVKRYEPYNACRDIALMRLPAGNPPELEVFHRRHMDMVVKYSLGQALYWLYDNRTGRGLGKLPIWLHDAGQDARSIGASAGNGVLLSEKGIAPSTLVIARNPDESDMALARIDHEPVSDREVRIIVFSDRDFYKPGDAVHIGGIVKEFASGKVSSAKTTAASLEIIGPDWENVKSDTLQLDAWGGF